MVKTSANGVEYVRFPSPCGDMVLKYWFFNEETDDEAWEFPSPCGDMVLKSDLPEGETDRERIVSVPLRGYGFEIGIYTGGSDSRRDGVSVPLRGYGFEILAVRCLAVPSSICRFAARMYFPSLSWRRCVLKAAVCPTALSAAGISLSV